MSLFHAGLFTLLSVAAIAAGWQMCLRGIKSLQAKKPMPVRYDATASRVRRNSRTR